MTEQEIQQKIDDRRNAIRFLPEAYSRDKVPKLYKDINWFENYASARIQRLKQWQAYDFDENRFYDAVNYTKDLFKVKDTFKLEPTSPFWDLYKAYMQLILEIGRYEFTVRWKGSFGDNQNKTNENILLYFTLFEDEMREIIMLLAKQYNENDELKTYIDINAVEFKRELEEEVRRLSQAREDYHRTWECMHRAGAFWRYKYFEVVTNREMTNAYIDWRKHRNSGCNLALEFIKWLECLAMKYSTEFKGDFKDYIKYLRKQPYYFCFINNYEKQQLEEAKRLRKEQSKQI